MFAVFSQEGYCDPMHGAVLADFSWCLHVRKREYSSPSDLSNRLGESFEISVEETESSDPQRRGTQRQVHCWITPRPQSVLLIGILSQVGEIGKVPNGKSKKVDGDPPPCGISLGLPKLWVEEEVNQWTETRGVGRATVRSVSFRLCNAEIRRKSAELFSTPGRYSYPFRQTATPILVFSGLVSPADDFQLVSAAFSTRRTRPRQRTRIFSPRVISEGMFKVSSISAPSVSPMSVNKKAPRELRS